MTLKLKLAGLLAGAVVLVGSEADAITTYTYTGNDYDVFLDNIQPDGTYTTSMNVSGSFTLSSSLAANFNTFITPLSFSFSDGRHTFTDATPNTLADFLLQTDTLGKISGWTIFLDTVVGLQSFRIITKSDKSIDGFFDQGDFFVEDTFGDEGFATLHPGEWSVTTTNEVPLPAALPLFASGLGALGLLGWWRKRKAAAALAA